MTRLSPGVWKTYLKLSFNFLSYQIVGNIYHGLNISNIVKLYNFIKHEDKKEAKQFNFHEYCTLKVQRLCIYYLKPNTRGKNYYNKYSKRIKIARKS